MFRGCSGHSVGLGDHRGNVVFYGCKLDGNGFYTDRNGAGTVAFYGCTFGEWESNMLYFREDISTENCEWHEITYYPDIEEDFDFRDTARIEAFDGEMLLGYWTCIKMTLPSEGMDIDLPYYFQDTVLEAHLDVGKVGEATFDQSTGESVALTWEMESDYNAAVYSEGDKIGGFTVYADYDESGESPMYLLMTIDDASFWFVKSVG